MSTTAEAQIAQIKEYIRVLVEAAPPLTDHQQAHLAALLKGTNTPAVTTATNS